MDNMEPIQSSTGEASKMPPIQLLAPSHDIGNSVFAAFNERKTIREISERPLSLQVLSSLLWAAYGVNRKTGPFGIPGRTAASASNSQEIDLYVAMSEGVFLYDAFKSVLQPILAEDLRARALNPAQKGFQMTAPVQLIYVADLHRLTRTAGYNEPGLHEVDVQKSYYFVDTGLIAGNVYLFAAANGLAAWFHNCDKTIDEKLKLTTHQRVLFAQSVGYPGKQ
ncbi:nitroreductase family protein [Bdellovibrio svalbardensis]|uniref:Nitroreductase family protein n=1 Tax=Bdellovibrio svalbardensis TaxID=2972972 RepID=A0ABT6DLC9_9BACT|nr:nitroreductase family protein [Bdellovibrio svalbardensis]MDG0817680.1 nitroreductase family protein [Bdellovibrio svalbardensis]